MNTLIMNHCLQQSHFLFPVTLKHDVNLMDIINYTYNEAKMPLIISVFYCSSNDQVMGFLFYFKL